MSESAWNAAREVSLLDLCEGRRELIVYRFYLDPDMQIADHSENGCAGCTMFADNIPNQLIHLNAHDTAMAGSQEAIGNYRTRMAGSRVRRHDEYTTQELAGGRS